MRTWLLLLVMMTCGCECSMATRSEPDAGAVSLPALVTVTVWDVDDAGRPFTKQVPYREAFMLANGVTNQQRSDAIDAWVGECSVRCCPFHVKDAITPGFGQQSICACSRTIHNRQCGLGDYPPDSGDLLAANAQGFRQGGSLAPGESTVVGAGDYLDAGRTP